MSIDKLGNPKVLSEHTEVMDFDSASVKHSFICVHALHRPEITRLLDTELPMSRFVYLSQMNKII